MHYGRFDGDAGVAHSLRERAKKGSNGLNLRPSWEVLHAVLQESCIFAIDDVLSGCSRQGQEKGLAAR